MFIFGMRLRKRIMRIDEIVYKDLNLEKYVNKNWWRYYVNGI